jgi:hypothetical protein
MRLMLAIVAALASLFVAAAPASARVSNFRLTDHERRSHELYYHADAPAIVIMTTGVGCPIARTAAVFLEEIRDAYADKGVVFFLLDPNLQDTREMMVSEAESFGIDIPVLMDEQQFVAEELGVERTAEVFVIDPAKGYEVAYHGPVDDRLSYERQRETAEHTWLIDALDAVLAGKEVATPEVADSPGCLINFPHTDKEEHAAISYSEHVAPILIEKCTACHAPGGIAPWAMTSYDLVRGYSLMIREVIRTDRMPPYFADPHVGTFKHDAALTPDQARTLVHWVEAGAQRGEGPDPLVEAVKPLPEWPLGEPDLILELPPFDIPATGVVEYQYPAVVNPLDHDVWLRASTIIPGVREGVHHILSGYMDEMPADGVGAQTSWRGSVGSYTPGQEAQIIPEDVGTPIPAGGAIGFQVHYTPFGREATSVTRVGLYFYDEPPKYVKRSSVIADFTLAIPPGEGDHLETAYMDFPRDAILYTIYPHAHYRGSSAELKIRYPDGREELLLSLPRYDFNWQRDYDLVEPLEIPAGSKLIARWTYDNSARNLANPDPAKFVTWGDQTFEEMAYMRVNYRWKDETSDNIIATDAVDIGGQLFGAVDDNLNGRIERAELDRPMLTGLAAGLPTFDKNGDEAIDQEEFAAVSGMMGMLLGGGGGRGGRADGDAGGAGEE